MTPSATTSLQLGSSYRQILAISLPISAALMVPFLNVTINNYFLSQLGESELGTAGITGVYFLVLAVIGNGLNNALQAIISRRAGENNADAIGRSFGQGMRIAVLFALTAIGITYLLAPGLLQYALYQQEVEARTLGFLKIRVWGLPFLYLFQMGNALLVGTTHSRYLIFGTAAETVVNVVLDYGLIFGNLGLPRLGFNGAAWASVAAEATGCCTVLLVIVFKGLHRQFSLFRYLRPLPTESRLLLRTSAPLIGQYGISIISWLLFYFLMEHRGEQALAISNMMRNVFMLTGIFTWAFASTTNTMVSNIIGQQRNHEVLPLIRKIMCLSLLAAVVMIVLLLLLAEPLFRFYGLSESFVTHALPVLQVVCGGILVMSAGVIWLNAVTGTGQTRINLWIEVVAIIVYVAYVLWVLEYMHWSIVWGWASEIFYWGVIGVLAFVYMHSKRWQQQKAF
ncbi:MAG: MATE family efflux transporter [Lacibacter sp.]